MPIKKLEVPTSRQVSEFMTISDEKAQQVLANLESRMSVASHSLDRHLEGDWKVLSHNSIERIEIVEGVTVKITYEVFVIWKSGNN